MVKLQKNVFEQTICDKYCAAWNEKYEFCEANLDYEGSVLSEKVDGKLTRRFGTLCKLSTKFKIVLDDEDIV